MELRERDNTDLDADHREREYVARVGRPSGPRVVRVLQLRRRPAVVALSCGVVVSVVPVGVHRQSEVGDAHGEVIGYDDIVLCSS